MHIGILYEDRIPRELFIEFEAAVRADGLEIRIESRPPAGPFAGIEWLIPSVVAAIIAKPYFDGFLGEMGKDHYRLLKKALIALYERVAGPEAPDVQLISTQGKMGAEQKYSLFFSVIAEATAEVHFKLLVPRPVTQAEYEEIVSQFMDFMDQVHADALDPRVMEAFRGAPRIGRTVLVRYDPVEKLIVPVDPTEGRLRE